MAPVTDQHVTALRAYLAGDPRQGDHLIHRLMKSGQIDGLGELVHAAFVVAARRRFSPTWTRAAVVQYVADVRTALSSRSEMLDPRTAENLIRRALGDHVTDDSSREDKAQSQIILLAALIADQGIDEQLDEFLATARHRTTQWWPDKTSPAATSTAADQPGAVGFPSRAASRSLSRDQHKPSEASPPRSERCGE